MNYSVEIDGSRIKDFDSFHDEFQAKIGFFEGYGRNLNAWVDCMTDMFTEGEYESLTKFNLVEGDTFVLIVANSEQWSQQAPEVFEEFVSCCDDCNREKTHFRVQYLGQEI